MVPDVILKFPRNSMGCRKAIELTVALVDESLFRIAKPGCRFNQRLQNRLQIERRPADDFEHARSRRLLLQRLVALPFQPLDELFLRAING
jgi:hypothetical protein